MKTINSFEDLKTEFCSENANNISSFYFRTYSKNISIVTGFLLGVKDEFLPEIGCGEKEYDELIQQLNEDENALAIRHLNNLRSNIMLYFKKTSRMIRISSAEYTPIYKIDYLKDDFKILDTIGINLSTGRTDLYEYIEKINNEISKKIDEVKHLYPEWVNFKYIKGAFAMPSDIKKECNKYQNNQSNYPYKRYFFWKNPEECGNMLITDLKLLDIIYKNFGDSFQEIDRVVDASENVKNNINEFINNGKKIQIFIDGENVDPYRFVSTIESLKDYEINKIDKIVVCCDEMYSPKAWELLKHFTFGIDVEVKFAKRIKEEKSLVDHKLVSSITEAYCNNVDSIILVSSDSDFWSVIEENKAKFLVLVESDKCGHGFKEVLRKNNVFYCYLDKFKTPEDNLFFKKVFCSELKYLIDSGFKLGNAKELMNEAILNSRASVSKTQRENIYKRYIEGLKLGIDENGNFQIIIPE